MKGLNHTQGLEFKHFIYMRKRRTGKSMVQQEKKAKKIDEKHSKEHCVQNCLCHVFYNYMKNPGTIQRNQGI